MKMDVIFHEKQEGYLCAQHCLNALLQEPYFNAVDLASLAEQLDQEERDRMAESGDTDDYRRFLEQPSGNMDDSGYFSVQVISSALKNLGLQLIPYSSTEPEAQLAQADPGQMTAYICNYKGHWFTIRKLGSQWFNLNSMLSGPQLISDFHLSAFLAQLIGDGYSIFIVVGDFPDCKAEKILSENPIVKNERPAEGHRLGTKEENDAANILKAVEALTEIVVPSTSSKSSDIEILSERRIPIKIEGQDVQIIDNEDDEENLQKALRLSLQDYEDKKDKSFSKIDVVIDDDNDEDDELRKALKLSLECVTGPPTPDQEEIRFRRLAYLIPEQKETPAKLNT